MTGKTHLLGGVLFGGAYIILTKSVNEMPYILAASAVGSLLPDIDHPGSTISKKNLATKFTSEIVSGMTKHRGFTHTVLFAAIVAALPLLIKNIIGSIAVPIAIGLFVGIISHLFLDTLNPTGIMWLYPFSRKYFHLMKIKTNTFNETLFFIILFAGTLGMYKFNFDF